MEVHKMKKSELNLVSVGSEIKSKKTNEVLTVNNIIKENNIAI